MRIVDVRPGNEDEDIAAGKVVVNMELDHPAKTVAIIRGEDPLTAQFADRVGVRSDPFPWREAVWLKVDNDTVKRILSADQYSTCFGSDESAAAAILDFADQLSSHLDNSASLMDIENAFLSTDS